MSPKIILITFRKSQRNEVVLPPHSVCKAGNGCWELFSFENEVKEGNGGGVVNN